MILFRKVRLIKSLEQMREVCWFSILWIITACWDKPGNFRVKKFKTIFHLRISSYLEKHHVKRYLFFVNTLITMSMVNSRIFALYPLYSGLSYHFQFNTTYDYTVQNQPRNFFSTWLISIRLWNKGLHLSRKKHRFPGKMAAEWRESLQILFNIKWSVLEFYIYN